MSRHFKIRDCCICGKTFNPKAANQKCCCQECADANRRLVAAAYRSNNPVRFHKDRTKKRKPISKLARINALARERGETYGMYVMREGLKN